MRKFLVLIGILFLIFCGFIVYETYFKSKIPVLTIEEERVNINNLYIYGTNLNISGSYNFLEDADFVLYDGDFRSYNINYSNGEFNISDLVNDGIYLDDIPIGDYYLFLRTTHIEEGEEKNKYYSLTNNTEYEETVYYSMSNYKKKIIINNETSYPTMMMHVSENDSDNIYDIVIDPGHGGMDGGASRNGYKETDFTLKLADMLRNELVSHGISVKLTHEVGQLSNNDRLDGYGVHGRAVVPREVNAKYMFSIHLNSNSSPSVSGLEIYTASNINYDFAKTLANNITSKTGIGFSNNKINKMFDGIYSKNFTNYDIESSINRYNEENLNAYNITTNSNYYYIIRESGGIVTGAYVDDRNSSIIGNPYTNSNVGTETYLLELGYLSNSKDLNNMINNMDKYVDAIAESIVALYEKNNS